MEVEAAQAPLLAAGCCAPLLRAATRHKLACLFCCACLCAALASIAAALLARRMHAPAAPAIGPSVVPGWLVERLFHEDGAASCPWTTAPAADADCRWRRARLEALRADISTCEEPLRLNEAVYAHRGAPLVAPEETEASWEVGVPNPDPYPNPNPDPYPNPNPNPNPNPSPNPSPNPNQVTMRLLAQQTLAECPNFKGKHASASHEDLNSRLALERSEGALKRAEP